MSFEDRPRFTWEELCDDFKPGAMISHFMLNDDNSFSIVSHINCEHCTYCAGNHLVEGLSLNLPDRLSAFKGLLGPFLAVEDIYEHEKVYWKAYDIVAELIPDDKKTLYELARYLSCDVKIAGPWQEKFVKRSSDSKIVTSWYRKDQFQDDCAEIVGLGPTLFSEIEYTKWRAGRVVKNGLSTWEKYSKGTTLEESKQSVDETLKLQGYLLVDK